MQKTDTPSGREKNNSSPPEQLKADKNVKEKDNDQPADPEKEKRLINEDETDEQDSDGSANAFDDK
jgi:hypothetical protein